METKLGVLPYGYDNGSHFAKLFTKTKFIGLPKDFTTDVSALLFWGGTDIFAGFYGETPNAFNQWGKQHPSTRDSVEWSLMGLAISRGIPIIGVCRGAQMACAKAGGKIIQHVDNHLGLQHDMFTKDDRVMLTNTCHHQMMLPPPEADVLAWAPTLSTKYLGEGNRPVDLPEGFKEPEVVHFKDINALGIQGHPEWLNAEHLFVKYCVDLVKEKLL